MSVRIERNRDPALAEALEREVGWPRAGREVARRFQLDPEGHFIARDDQREVLGSASCTAYADTLAWIGGMVVREKARGRGVGSALLTAALAHARERDRAIVGLDATPLGRPLYTKAGFTASFTTTRWERASDASGPAPPEGARPAMYPFSHCEIMELLAYDRARFGAGRGALLSAILADFPERAFVAFDRASGAIVGFVMGQENLIGPLVADSPDIARWLLYAAQSAGSPARAIVIGANAQAAAAFTAAGYHPTPGQCERMTLGAPLPGRPGAQYCAAAWALG